MALPLIGPGSSFRGFGVADLMVDVAILLDRLPFASPVVANGAASVSLDLTLPRNAVVRQLDLLVRARTATGFAWGLVAQVRGAEASTADVVLDFRMLRTVSGVQAPEGFQVLEVYPWTGAAFADKKLETSLPARTVTFSEVRTERLRVVLNAPVALSRLETDAAVILPEAPADLELRIDGGAPVWTHPGPVIPGTATSPADDAWDVNGLRVVHLAEAFAPLVGDALGEEEEVTFKVTLSSRVPGVFALLAVTPDLSYVSRAKVPDEVELDAEGRLEVPLELPAVEGGVRQVEEVRFTLLGTPPEERAVGPLDAFTPVEPELPYPAELVADPDHAFCALLPSHPALAALTAVRLPLTAGPSGAEARVVLWQGITGPETAVDNGTSEPVSLEAPPARGPAGESWVTFPFKRPVPLDAGVPLWAALVVSRGSAVWGLGALPRAAAGTEAPRRLDDLRRGSPAGPWKRLPEALSAIGPLDRPVTPWELRARLRAVGKPGKTPLPLLRVGLAGAPASADVEVTPAPKGVAVALGLVPSVAAGVPALALTGRAAVDLTLRDVDVVWRLPVIG